VKYPLFIDGKVVTCGQPAHFPFYIRHYQALSWDDHQELRVKRLRSASNTPNGWSGSEEKIWKTWKSYHFNSSCPLGGEGGYRQLISSEVINSIRNRIADWMSRTAMGRKPIGTALWNPKNGSEDTSFDSLIDINVEQWLLGQRLYGVAFK
jgi:hypothetical protein